MPNPLVQKVMDGDKLTADELSELIEAARPKRVYTRVTGRKTRTGTEGPEKDPKARVHRAKWEDRNG